MKLTDILLEQNCGCGQTPCKTYGINEELNVARKKLDNIVKFVGAVNFAQMIISLRDENVQDEIVSAFEDQYPAVMDKRDDLQKENVLDELVAELKRQ